LHRGHEGTVYSLDTQWKAGRPPPANARKKRTGKVEPAAGDDEGVITLVSGSHDQSILVWDVITVPVGKKDISLQVDQTRKLHSHTADVYALELLLEPDKRYGMLVSGGDYTVRSWNIEQGVNIQTLHGHTGYVACLRIRGKRAFSGSWDTTVRSWNLEAGKGMHVFKGHKNIVNCIDVTDTDIFSGSWDMTVIQWSRATGEPVNVFHGHTDGVQCLQIHDELLFSGSMDKSIRVWNPKVNEHIIIF
ncbi:WD40-repeat-containing domain protein, partial [Blyttiomyces helicus]